jgi:hypothetical protein
VAAEGKLGKAADLVGHAKEGWTRPEADFWGFAEIRRAGAYYGGGLWSGWKLVESFLVYTMCLNAQGTTEPECADRANAVLNEGGTVLGDQDVRTDHTPANGSWGAPPTKWQ